MRASRAFNLLVAGVLLSAAPLSSVFAVDAAPTIDACSLLNAADIEKVLGVAVEKGAKRDAGRESNGAYSSSCVWTFTGENRLPVDQSAPLGGRSFVILNAQRWPAGSEGARSFLNEFRAASAGGVLKKQPVARQFGDEALWWGDGLAVRRRDVSFGISVFTPRDTPARANAQPGDREGRLAQMILARLPAQADAASQRNDREARSAETIPARLPAQANAASEAFARENRSAKAIPAGLPAQADAASERSHSAETTRASSPAQAGATPEHNDREVRLPDAARAARLPAQAGAASHHNDSDVRLADATPPARLPAQAGRASRRGEYLVRAANCVSCHTEPGGAVFAGGVPFATDFGTIYSTNITPDKATGIGSWTFQQFDAAVRSGVRPDGQHLYPAFPYTNFTKINDADMHALYDYFMSLRPVSAAARKNEMSFPFDQRWLLGAWKALFFTEERFVSDAARPEEWNRGAYLVEALAHCSACHSPRNFLGAEKMSAQYTGGVLAELDEERGPVRRGAPNLTSSPHGLGAWSAEDLAGYLKLGVGSRARLMGTMNEVVLNSTRHLSEADTQAMAVYIKSLEPAGDTGSRPSQKVMDLGAKQFDIHCGTCHLPTGLGSDDTGPPIAGSAFAQAPDPSSLIDLVINGPRDPVPAPSPQWQRPWQPMPAFGQKMSDEQAAALLTFVRNSWGNAAGTVKPKDIDRLRF